MILWGSMQLMQATRLLTFLLGNFNTGLFINKVRVSVVYMISKHLSFDNDSMLIAYQQIS